MKTISTRTTRSQLNFVCGRETVRKESTENQDIETIANLTLDNSAGNIGLEAVFVFIQFAINAILLLQSFSFVCLLFCFCKLSFSHYRFARRHSIRTKAFNKLFFFCVFLIFVHTFLNSLTPHIFRHFSCIYVCKFISYSHYLLDNDRICGPNNLS